MKKSDESVVNLPPLSNCRIAILGLGYVGLPLAIEFAKTKICKRSGEVLDRKVIGFDIDKSRIDELKTGFDRTCEVLDSEKSTLKEIYYTSSLKEIIDFNCDVFIVTVPTPIDSSKKPVLDPLKNASQTIAMCLKEIKNNSLKNKNPVLIYESTVFPGATEEVCIPIIEEISSQNHNIDFYYGYSPERINPGDKFNRLSSIKKVTSGSNDISSIWIDKLYGSIIDAGTFPVSSVKAAEASKIIENTQRDLNIALINEFALIFQKLGVNTKEVIEAASTKWNFVKLLPGLVGGHCIGVDPYYLTYKSKEVGYIPNIILAGRKMNDSMGSNIAEIIIKKMIKKSISIMDSKILIMGFSFKENCPDIRNTGVFNTFKELRDFQCDVDIYDPWVDDRDAYNQYNLKVFNEIPKKKYSAVFIAVGHKCFKDIGVDGILKFCEKNHIIFDLKYLFLDDKRVFNL